MTLVKSFIRKNELLSTLIAVLLILTIGCIVFPLIISLACKVLMIIFTKPVMALAVIGAFFIGMFFNEFAHKFDSK